MLQPLFHRKDHNNGVRWILITSSLACLPLLLYGQDTTLRVQTTFERFFSTLSLQSHLYLQWRSPQVVVNFSNRYQGSTILDIARNTRDQNTSTLRLHWQFSPSFAFVTRSDFWLISDSQAQPLNRRLQFAALPGIRWHPASPPLSLWGGAGMVFSTQFGKNEYAPAIGVEGQVQIPWNSYIFHLKTQGQWSWFSERQNGFWSTNVSIETGTRRNQLHLGGATEIARRDYYLPFGSEPVLLIEQRQEQRHSATLQLHYVFSPTLRSTFRTNWSIFTIARRYNRFLAPFSETALLRSLQRQRAFLQLQLNGALGARLRFQTTLMLQYHADDESARSTGFPITAADLRQWQQRANFMDFQQSDRQLQVQLSFAPTDDDTVQLRSFISLLQYDTPAESNVDDRDELRWNAALTFSHRHSSLLRFQLATGINFHHLVYLKAARSAQNYREYKLHLIPSVRWSLPRFSLAARFFITAHYVVYDFETLSQTPRSYSIRQIGYQDSLIWKLNPRMWLLFLPAIRYAERGILFWDQFAEHPDTRTYEHELLLLFYRRLAPSLTGGIGVRWFHLQQHSISSPALQQRSSIFGPQLDWQFRVDAHNTLVLRGWYELHWNNEKLVLQRPQLRLEAKVQL